MLPGCVPQREELCGLRVPAHAEWRLKPGHSYYRIRMQWCDFVVFAEEDLLVQRIYKDAEVTKVIRESRHYFFFYHYLI